MEILTESLQPLDPPIDIAMPVGEAEDIATTVFVAIFIIVEVVDVATATTVYIPISISISIISYALLLMTLQRRFCLEGAGEERKT